MEEVDDGDEVRMLLEEEEDDFEEFNEDGKHALIQPTTARLLCW